MAFTIYSSNDDSAPVLNGAAGSLISVLDACLVNGYGSMPSAGWTKPFSGTNKAVYQQGAGSCGFHLRVLDDASLTSAGRAAFCTGYKTMSSVDVGGGQFPHAAIGMVQANAFFPFRKSDNANSTAVPWMLFADSMTFYLLNSVLGTSSAAACGFGDFYSMAPGLTDPNRCFIAGYNQDSTGTSSAGNSGLQNPASWSDTIPITVSGGISPYGLGLAVALLGDTIKGVLSVMNGQIQTPNGPDSGFYLAPFYLGVNSTKQLRGRLRGYWYWLHPGASINHGDIFSGTGPLSGKQFMAVKMGGSTNTVIMEISDTLETNV